MSDIIQQVSFEVCEKEPLANSGLIQGAGALLFIEKKSGDIKYASENVPEWLGEEVEDLLGADGLEWLEINVPDAVSLPSAAGKRMQLSNALDAGFGELDLQISATSNGWVLEFEKSRSGDSLKDVELMKIAGIPDETMLRELQQSLVESISAVSGYDRVMLYKFGPDWSGEVLAETVAVQSGDYLGLRFPATDIPSIARGLYAKLPYRHIPDATQSPVQIKALAGSGEQMDLTWSDLRSVSPFHITYLNNMGVRSSFSVSIMVEGQLWGLIACHHHEALAIPLTARVRCKALVDEYVESLLSYRGSIQRELYQRVAAVLEPLEQNLTDDLIQMLGDRMSDLGDLTEASKVAMVVDGAIASTLGEVDLDGVLRLHEWSLHNTPEEVVTIDNLPAIAASSAPEGVCGVMALHFRAKKLNNAAMSVYFMRPEEAGEIAWAGNQEQVLEAAKQGQLSPRSSFEKWVEVRTGFSRAWDEDVRFIGAQVRERLAVIL